MINGQQYYSTKDIHQITGIALKTVQDWAHKRVIPGQIRMGHFWRFNKDVVDKALASNDFLVDSLPL